MNIHLAERCDRKMQNGEVQFQQFEKNASRRGHARLAEVARIAHEWFLRR